MSVVRHARVTALTATHKFRHNVDWYIFNNFSVRPPAGTKVRKNNELRTTSVLFELNV